MRRSRVSAVSLVRALAVAVLGAVLLTACGSNRPETLTAYKDPTPRPKASNTLLIYSSLPERGPQRAASKQIIDGINLELNFVEHRVMGNHYHLFLRPLDDATAAGPTAPLTLSNAHRAARDQNTIAYIGELNSSATMLSLPILNQAGIVQITPGSSYPGLTNALDPSTRITDPNEPDKYYPQRTRTLLRQIPNDVVQAAAVVDQLKKLTCTHVSAVSFGGGIEGPRLVNAIEATTKLYHVTYVPPPKPGTDTSTYANWAAKLRDRDVGCFVLAGRVTPDAIALTKEIHVQLPSAPILGSSGLCNAAWTDQRRHGVSADADPKLFCTSPLFPVRTYAGANAFRGSFRSMYGHEPGPYALYGYMAAEMIVQTLNTLTPAVDTRSELRGLLVQGRPEWSSVLKDFYTFNEAGNVSSNRYALYRIDDHGRLIYAGALTPPHVLTQRLHYEGS